MSFYQWDGENLLLTVYVQPKASRSEIVGIHDDKLKVKVTSAPTDGLANADVIKLLAKTFGVAKSHITLISGHTQRNKRFRVFSPKKLPDFLPQRLKGM